MTCPLTSPDLHFPVPRFAYVLVNFDLRTLQAEIKRKLNLNNPRDHLIFFNSRFYTFAKIWQIVTASTGKYP